jgi:uncharacterized protein YjiK
MLSRYLIFLLSSFAGILAFESCTGNYIKADSGCKEYDLNHPYILTLNDALREISGINFYPKDTSVFAISDELGYLFKIQLKNRYVTQKWKFDKALDFEDVSYHDSLFYVLESNGNIHTLQFSGKGDTITTQTTVFNPVEKSKNEFESLYYDSTRKLFIMICKDCEADKKSSVTAYSYDPEKHVFTPSVFTIDANVIAQKIGLKKMKFKPSAAGINPLTGDLWILSATNELLVRADQDGNCKDAYPLNPGLYTQPEGISFTPKGDMIISNEAGNKHNSPTIFIFKRKKVS